jgi:hypothetical protein
VAEEAKDLERVNTSGAVAEEDKEEEDEEEEEVYCR